MSDYIKIIIITVLQMKLIDRSQTPTLSTCLKSFDFNIPTLISTTKHQKRNPSLLKKLYPEIPKITFNKEKTFCNSNLRYLFLKVNLADLNESDYQFRSMPK